jgi:hypothetical protein
MTQGTMMETEDQVETKELDVNGQPIVKDDDDTLVTTTKVGDKEMVPLSTLIETRRQAKEAKRQVAELTRQVEGFKPAAEALQNAAPILSKLQGMNEQQVSALVDSVKSGTAPSRAQDQAVEDTEARELAEDLGLVDAGGSLDVARGRRMLDKIDARATRLAQKIVAPYAQSSAQQTAYGLRERMKQQADPNTGVPFATAESIDEAYAMLPAELAANGQTAAVILGTAMVIDRSKGRVPKAPERYDYSEPLMTEAAGGRRGPAPLSAEMQSTLTKLGLTEKEFNAAQVPQRGGIGRGTVME